MASRAILCPGRNAVPERSFAELTEREREVLALIAQGYSNPQMASHLVLSPKTVLNHISNTFSKLQVADRAEAIVRAREGRAEVTASQAAQPAG
jgi:DNA-binding NarL/FixJ family response regulator